jgi:chromosome segregation ATPase
MSTDQPGPEEKQDIEATSPDVLSDDELSDSLKERLQLAWDKREPKWYERLAPAQKHWVDKLVAIRLDEFEAHLAALDRQDSQLAHQVAELTAQLGELNRRLVALESRIDQLKSGREPGQQE